jgi:hypothetical protein
MAGIVSKPDMNLHMLATRRIYSTCLSGSWAQRERRVRTCMTCRENFHSSDVLKLLACRGGGSDKRFFHLIMQARGRAVCPRASSKERKDNSGLAARHTYMAKTPACFTKRGSKAASASGLRRPPTLPLVGHCTRPRTCRKSLVLAKCGCAFPSM